MFCALTTEMPFGEINLMFIMKQQIKKLFL